MKKLLFAFSVLVLVSCGPSTQIVKSWTEPGATVSPNPSNKPFVIAMVKDETSRRIIEDQLVKLMTNATASYTALSSEKLKEGNEQALAELLKNGGYTHVLMMRLADVEKETTYTPGTTTAYYGGYGRYYRYGGGFYSTPGYYSTDKNYFVETTIYSVNDDKLLWTGTTKTVNPAKIETMVNEIAKVVAERMRKDGFLK